MHGLKAMFATLDLGSVESWAGARGPAPATRSAADVELIGFDQFRLGERRALEIKCAVRGVSQAMTAQKVNQRPTATLSVGLMDCCAMKSMKARSFSGK